MLLGLKSCPRAFEGMVKQKDPVSVFFFFKEELKEFNAKNQTLDLVLLLAKLVGRNG